MSKVKPADLEYPNWVYPHCDGRVLHAPGECVYCDEHPDWQKLRADWGIAFTGHRGKDKDLIPCPSEHRRPFKVIDQWHGNKAHKKDCDHGISP